MNVVFLGVSSDDKKFFILCLAKIISCFRKVVVYSTTPYGCSKENQYDFCGIEIHLINKDDALGALPEEENINFIDIEEYMPLYTSFKTVAVCETSRCKLEQGVQSINKFASEDRSRDIFLVYLNILEYCRINEKYLDVFLEKELLSSVLISHKSIFVFEEENRIIMTESLFNERLPIKKLTKSFRLSLMNMARVLMGLEQKKAKRLLKKAERG